MSSFAELVDTQYGYHEIVDTRDGDGTTIELYSCLRCGACVRALAVETHSQWHEQLQAVG